MKYTKAQLREKENLEWFCPNLFKRWPPQEGDFDEYLAHSERGVPIKNAVPGMTLGNVYAEAKRWRGIIIHELWEESFYADDGSWPGYDGLLREEDGTPIPEHIKDYIKKEIFRGQDAEVIDRVWAAAMV